jgi:hypothetical protein
VGGSQGAGSITQGQKPYWAPLKFGGLDALLIHLAHDDKDVGDLRLLLAVKIVPTVEDGPGQQLLPILPNGLPSYKSSCLSSVALK